MGSFDEWSSLVRQALIWAGEADALEGQTQLVRESNPMVEAERCLLTCWAACYPKSEAVTLQRVKQDIELYAALPPKPPNEWNNLRDALGEFDPRYDGNTFNPKIVGYALRSMQGRVRDGKRLVRGGITHGTTAWQVTAL
jgi:putative DNA primase/helicase